MPSFRTPFIGPAYIERAGNFASARLINLYPEFAEGPGAKGVGVFYATPGLGLDFTVGSGPIRGMAALNGVLYVVSGNAVYQISSTIPAAQIGTLPTSTGPVSIVSGTNQLVIFDGMAGTLAPAGYPLTGGTLGSGGSQNAVGDVITLAAAGGTQVATATVTVTSVNAGVITGFTISSSGSFTSLPTGFTQASTTGSGSGFTLTSPTFGTAAQLFTLNLPFPNPVMGAYQDGFGLVMFSNSNKIAASNALDLSVWYGLSFGVADGNAENAVALANIHREVWVFKSTVIEVWDDTGAYPFPFARNEGVYPEVGCAAPFSVAQAGEFLIFLAQTKMGDRRVCMMEGYKPVFISTAAIEQLIAPYATVSDAIGYAYEQQGHIFYVLTFPSGNETWVYDLTESSRVGMPIWHKRAAFANGQFSRHWGNCYAFFNETHLVGDYQSGNVYYFSLGAATDNGQQRKWLRSWRALPKPTDRPLTFHSLRIDMETGIGVTAGTNPQAVLRWSDDGGHTWSSERYAAAGTPGQTAQRVMFRRLGSTRRNSGLDRTFELSSTDVFQVGLIGAELDAS